eukprot:gene6932-12548_t
MPYQYSDINLRLAILILATANGWNDAARLRKLPAFLCGQASSFYHTLAAEDTDSYANLTSSLRRLLCPLVAREQYFFEFDARYLRPGKDPSLYLHELTELLYKADPDLVDDAKQALSTRQFMKGLPADTRLKLLESNPTPTLEEIRDFLHRFYATRPLTAAVTALTTEQSKLQTAVEDIQRQH